MTNYDPRLIAFIGTHEGLVLKAYKDPTGTITIGYGFTWGSHSFREYWMKTRGHKLCLDDRITIDECAKLLKSLIDSEYAPAPLMLFENHTLHAKAAAIDMTYNAGLGSLKWTWAGALKAGKLREAAKRYRATAITSRGLKLPGLVRRRREMSLVMENNVWPSWLKTGPAVVEDDPVKAPWRLSESDMREAQKMLVSQGHDTVLMTGRRDEATRIATLKFQKEHPHLDNDGIMGRATYSALQRIRNLKRESGLIAGAGAVSAVVGNAGIVMGTNWLLGGTLAPVMAAAGYLLWAYRDEVKLVMRNL